MLKNSIKTGLMVALAATVGMVGQASAGSGCASGAGWASAPRASAVRPMAYRTAQVSRPVKQALVAKAAPSKAAMVRVASATQAVTDQGGGDTEVAAPVPAKQASATSRIETPVAEAPAPAPTTAADAPEYTSVAGIAARLAAMSARQRSASTAD